MTLIKAASKKGGEMLPRQQRGNTGDFTAAHNTKARFKFSRPLCFPHTLKKKDIVPCFALIMVISQQTIAVTVLIETRQ